MRGYLQEQNDSKRVGKTGNLEHVAQSAGNSTGWTVSRCLNWFLPLFLPDSFAVFCFLYRTGLRVIFAFFAAWFFFLELFWFFFPASLFNLREGHFVNLVGFRIFLKLFSVVCLQLKELFCGIECFNLKGSCWILLFKPCRGS